MIELPGPQTMVGPLRLVAVKSPDAAAVHADAATAESTDWSQIVALYDQLHGLRPNNIVALNRAVAVAELRGPQAGLDALTVVDLDSYHLFHAIQAELFARLGETGDALAAYDRAAALTTNEVELRHLASGRAAVARRDGE